MKSSFILFIHDLVPCDSTTSIIVGYRLEQMLHFIHCDHQGHEVAVKTALLLKEPQFFQRAEIEPRLGEDGRGKQKNCHGQNLLCHGCDREVDQKGHMNWHWKR